MVATKFKTVDEYLSALPSKVKKLMKDMRLAIKQSAPDAEEVISYNMPAIKLHGIVVYYAAHTKHIGFYPGNSVTNEVFKNELKKYETSKGTVKFPFEKPLPIPLIKKIVKYRVNENLLKAKAKLKK